MKRNRIDTSLRHRATGPQALRARRFFRPRLEQFEDRRLLATVTVNTTSDVNDGTTTSIAALLAAPGVDGFISLREAILAANNTVNVDGPDAGSDPDPDTVHFNIPGTGVKTITPTSVLPTITEAVVIDGYTQGSGTATTDDDAKPNTLAVGSDAVLLIEINGSNTGRSGIVLGGTGGSTVRGLVINRSGGALGSDSGIFVSSNNNIIAGNFIGTDATGSAALGNPFNGVTIVGDNNLIGGTTPAARNLISGNKSTSVGLGNVVVGGLGAKPSGTIIRGNYIGTNAAGTAALTTNQGSGIRVLNSVNTTIGGSDVDDGAEDGQVWARNLISGNSFAGIHLEKQSGTFVRAVDGVAIVGNFIGVNAAGVAAIPNMGPGIAAYEASDTTTLVVGGTAPGAGNVISGNRASGFAGGALTMTVQGNFVGTDLSGTLDLGNGLDGGAGQGSGGEGVHVSMGGNEGPNYQITVGGTTPAARNIISGNAANGVWVTGVRTGSVIVQGNYIGTQADGLTPLPNQFSGIEVSRSLAIGGTVAGAGNVIAFNRRSGVSAPTSGSGPFVGMSILGNSIHSNSLLGIDLNFSGPSLNDLGDTDTNVINNGQNFPVLTGVNAVNGDTVISGRLNSTPSSTFRIEFFYNDVRDPSGYGEGPTYLGFTNVTTDSNGNVSFDSPVVPGIIPAGRFVTATATVLSRSAIAVAPETSEFSFALASLIVTNTLDSGIGSLREAITLANTFANFDRDGLAGNEVDPITFVIPAAGVQTITPISALPTISEALSIDGYTQPGASPNSLAMGNNAVLLIELNGASVGGSANGLTLSGVGGSTVRGLAVNRFGGSGVELVSGNNVVEGSYLGIDPGGTIERSNSFAGVRVSQGANNRIGGTTTQARNVIAGNGSTTGTAQIVVGQLGRANAGTVIRGNYIGVNSAGNAAVHPTASGNDDGIYVVKGDATIIGGADADDGMMDGVVLAGNVISGNVTGIRIGPTGNDETTVNGITIQGNIVGLDATGTTDLGNFGDGILAGGAAFGPSNMQIGGTQPGAGNIISANDGRGFIGSAANLVLEGNRVGTDASGTLNFGNGSQGVHISLFSVQGLNYQIRVGGTVPAARNIISGNARNGVLVADAVNATTGSVAIQGNYIGTQADGQSPLPNLFNGIELQRNGSVGGTAAGAGNVIAFNRQRGVDVLSFTVPILGNSIFSNGAAGNSLSHLGIDLGENGVTLNDPNDADFGYNRLQNFPVLSSATRDSTTVTIQYSVPSSSFNASYPLRIEFFKADVDGQEGQAFLGFDTVTAAEAGTVKTVVFTPAVTLAANDKVVATATDSLGNSSEFSASQTMTTANQPPVITSNGGGDTATIAVPENSTLVTIVAATDPDAGATLTYGIVGGADADKFAINATSGLVAFAAAPNFETPTDADANNSYLVNVQASDGSSTDLQTLTVTVTNVNEPPTITSNGGGDTASISVPENTTTVTTVKANDPDAGATIVYGISGGADAAKFTIDPSSGTLAFLSPPSAQSPQDAGGDNVYEVTVQVSDGALTDTQTLSVTVTDVNEAPTITSNGGGATANVSVAENTTGVTTVTANDPDAGTTLTYSIVGGDDADKFAINATSGGLAFVSAPNFEAPSDADANNSYVVIVQAGDGSLTDSQTLTVTVTNVNEPPTITSNGGGDTASISVPENTTAVTTVTANDPDAGATIVYGISGGVDAAQFMINPSSGALTFIAAPNFEAPADAGQDGVYDVIVQASDGVNTDSQTLAVTVTNVNEAPVITSDGGGATAAKSVLENTTAVTTVTAVDPDLQPAPVFSLAGGADVAKFTIDPSSGTLAFLSPPSAQNPQDAGGDNVYEMIVQASDGALTDTQTLSVTVTNINEAPTITSNGGGSTATVVVPENITNVTTVTATDPDVGTTLTYSIVGGVDAAKFTINATTGLLAFVTEPNFESPTDGGGNNVYDVAVQVSDGNLADTQAISVTVTDVAEAAYTISGKVYKDVTGNGKSADDLPWAPNAPVTLNLYRDVNEDGAYQTSDTWLASTFTGSGGVYSFTSPAAGKYIVKEVVPNNFVRTFPVLNDYAAVNLTTSTSNGNDWYNAPKYNNGIVTNVSFIVDHGGVLTTVSDLRGNTHEGDKVTANFTVSANEQFTLVSYLAPGPTFDPNTASQQSVFTYASATFGPGTHSLTVQIPKSFYQIDFVVGPSISQLGPAGSNIFYASQCRLISADNGGVNLPNGPAIDLALSTTVNNPTPQLGSNVVLTVTVSNAAGWSAATGVRVKDALPSGLTFVSATATQGTYNSSSGEWILVNPLNSGATATLTITATVATAGEKKNAAQVTAAGAPDIDSTPNNDSSPSTPHNEDDDDSVNIVPQLWTKFFVINDSSSGSTREKTFEYAPDGTAVENYQLNSGNTAPRGAATTAAGSKVWVVDANKKVFVYDASGTLLGSWSAGGLSSSATPEGIATNGTDIWIVDAYQDKVFKFANAASRTTGSQNAASSFALNIQNKNPKDIVASSTHLWVVNDSSTDKVFKYTLAGTCVGSWTISGGGGSPTGITLDPANVNHLWVVDKSTDRVYQFNSAASRTSGSQAAMSTFLLGSGNTSPEGIADPPPPAKQVATHIPVALRDFASSNQAFDIALLTMIDELDGWLGRGRKKK